MMLSLRRFCFWIAVGALASLATFAPAQEMRVQSTPFAAWLDFKALVKTPGAPLPLWVRSFQREITAGVDGTALKTTFRLRLDQLDDSERDLLIRLVFDDWHPDAITVTGWSAGGVALFTRGPFGAGLLLPSSETLIVPVIGVERLDIETRGDGRNLRGVYVSWLDKAETRQALDFPPPAPLADPFDNPPSQFPPLDDLFLGGRVRATIDPGVVKLAPRVAPHETWEFDLDAPPFVAVLSFEILNADPLAPLEVFVNDQPLGPAAMRTPDLADPAFQGVVRPVDRGVQFRYAGWIQCQKAIPGAVLRAGANRVQLRLPANSGPVAVRSLELQLKTQWQSPEHTFTPSTP